MSLSFISVSLYVCPSVQDRMWKGVELKNYTQGQGHFSSHENYIWRALLHFIFKSSLSLLSWQIAARRVYHPWCNATLVCKIFFFFFVWFRWAKLIVLILKCLIFRIKWNFCSRQFFLVLITTSLMYSIKNSKRKNNFSMFVR